MSVLRNKTRTQVVLIKEQDRGTINFNFHCVRGEVEKNNWFPIDVGMGYLRMRDGCICSWYVMTFCTNVQLGYLLRLKSSEM